MNFDYMAYIRVIIASHVESKYSESYYPIDVYLENVIGIHLKLNR